MARKRKPTDSEIIEAARMLGQALNNTRAKEDALQKYKDKLYPDGTTIRQEMALTKDPKHNALWEDVSRAEAVEWSTLEMFKKLARRM